MEELTLVSKVNPAAGVGSQSSGRPPRTGFCMRRYEKLTHIGLPSHLCEDGDRVDFMISDMGFAVRIGLNGGRSISKGQTGKTAMVPRQIMKVMPEVPNGTLDLVSENVGGRTWFFPFNQF